MKFLLLIVAFAVGVCSGLDLSLKRGLTDAEKQYALDYHNYIRAIVASGKGQGGQPTGSNILPMIWNDDLASQAQSWADNCEGPPHDAQSERIKGTPFPDVGQNMMPCTHGRRDCIDESMVAFYHEAVGYTFSNGACTMHECTHYTQLVWATSAYVGCGYNWCPDSVFARLICNYGPSGNVVGEKPYTSGPTASNCPKQYPFSMSGICASKSQCDESRTPCKCTVNQDTCTKNGGTFDAATCNCKCSGNSVGLNCQATCTNEYGDGACDYYKGMGLCSPSSDYYSLMQTSCTKSCGLCDNIYQFPSNPAYKVNGNLP